jgi:hypothetical protein
MSALYLQSRQAHCEDEAAFTSVDHGDVELMQQRWQQPGW